MSFRAWLSIITLVLVGVILYLSRHELERAWELLANINLWILALIVPISAIAYLANGEMIFSYLRQKRLLSHVNPLTFMRISLELNFVNHVLPSGGVSGISYMNWRLGKLGVSAGRATMAQAVRYVVGFAAMVTLLMLAVLVVTIDGDVNRWIILMSSALVSLMVFATLAVGFLLNSQKRIEKFSGWVTRLINRIVRTVTFGRKYRLLGADQVKHFFGEMHDDFLDLKREKKMLKKPYLWGIVFTVAEISLFWVTFWALGSPVNPAPILIAYGVASLAGFVIVTPGGAGVYEAIMVFVLATAGLSQGKAIAGIVLARIIILLTTIGLGYVFYQMAVMKYGKRPRSSS